MILVLEYKAESDYQKFTHHFKYRVLGEYGSLEESKISFNFTKGFHISSGMIYIDSETVEKDSLSFLYPPEVSSFIESDWYSNWITQNKRNKSIEDIIQ